MIIALSNVHNKRPTRLSAAIKAKHTNNKSSSIYNFSQILERDATDIIRSVDKDIADLSTPPSVHGSTCTSPANADHSTTFTETANLVINHDKTFNKPSVSTELSSVNLSTPLSTPDYVMNATPFTNI